MWCFAKDFLNVQNLLQSVPSEFLSLWYLWAGDALLSPESHEMLCACAYMLLDRSYLGKVHLEAMCLSSLCIN